MDASAEVLTVVLFSLGAFLSESRERIKKKKKDWKKKIPLWCKWRVTYEYLTNEITHSPADEKQSQRDPGVRTRASDPLWHFHF